MKTGVRVLLFDGAPQRAGDVRRGLLRNGLLPDVRRLDAADERPLSRGDLAVVVLDSNTATGAAAGGKLAALLERLVEKNVATVVWGAAETLSFAGGPLIETLAPDAGLDVVLAKLGTLARYAPLVQRLETEVQHLHRLAEQLNRYFSDIDHEMRLAGRLQRDFLPTRLPDTPPLVMSSLYRPASWVSGDIYDAFRIDERNVGLFVADAMGHGVAAGLLTMFLRQALVSKRIENRSYTIVPPGEALAELNACLVRQKLPQCQFVTAAYCVVDAARRELCVARAGHPYPLHIRANGEIREIQPTGGLLGLSDLDPQFDEARVKLHAGDKVILYTDGVEDVFGTDERDAEGQCIPSQHLREWARYGPAEFIETLTAHLDHREGSLHPPDDVTVLVLGIGA